MDALSDALQALRVSGSMFIDADLRAPWAVVTPSSVDIAGALGVETDRVIPYHLVTQGECVVTIEGHAATRLRAGDIALFPHGHVHLLASGEGVAPLTMSRDFAKEVLARRNVLPIRQGGDGDPTRLLCGFFAIERRGGDHVVAGLPALLTAHVGA
jgi:hypothetical protein